jgi:GNAT superfamily N-acetyltransferase
MRSSTPVELVVASFDDPILARLGVEPEAGIVFLVARRAGEPIGCAGLRRLADDTAELEHVYVRPAYRGRGVPRLLLAGVEDLARRRGFTVARLEVADSRTAGLYESSGYVRVTPPPRRAARSVRLEKSLGP